MLAKPRPLAGVTLLTMFSLGLRQLTSQLGSQKNHSLMSFNNSLKLSGNRTMDSTQDGRTSMHVLFSTADSAPALGT
jgi:hypothetical protein